MKRPAVSRAGRPGGAGANLRSAQRNYAVSTPVMGSSGLLLDGVSHVKRVLTRVRCECVWERLGLERNRIPCLNGELSGDVSGPRCAPTMRTKDRPNLRKTQILKV